jgi:hypothetical protein
MRAPAASLKEYFMNARKPIPEKLSVLSLWTGLLACSALAVGIYITISTSLMMIRCWYPVPYADQWNQIVGGRTIDWPWLISRHNEHRIPFPRLVFMLDYWWAGERNIVDFACNILIQAGFCALLIALSNGTAAWNRAHRIWAAGLILAFLFWAAPWDNFIWGFQVGFFGVMLATTATFAALALRPPTAGALMLVIALEIVSIYTLSSGVVVPLLAIVLAIWLGRSRLHIAVLTAAAVLLTAWYLNDYQAAAVNASLLNLVSNLGPILKYMATEMGGPIAEAAWWIGPIDQITVAARAGAVCLAVFAVITVGRLRSATPREAVLIILGCFLVSMALLTAIGRVSFGLEQALAIRYATPAGLFWLAILLLIAMRRPSIGLIVAIPAFALIASSQPWFVKQAGLAAVGRTQAEPALLAGVADKTLLNVNINPNFILQQRPLMKLARSSVFADDWAAWDGTPLSAHVAVTDATQCRGSFDAVTQISDAAYPGWHAAGKYRSPHDRHDRERIVLTDGAGQVVGYGLGGFTAAQVGLVPESTGKDKVTSWWLGAFTGDRAEQTTAYLLLDQATACPIGKAPTPITPVAAIVTDTHPAGLPPGGFLHVVEGANNVVLDGWGMFQQMSGAPRLMIDTNLPIKSTDLSLPSRPDVAATMNDPGLVDSGFTITLDLDASATRPGKVRLCVWTVDSVYGRHLLQYPTQPDLCPS